MGEGWGEGEKAAFQRVTSPSPLSPPTRGGELGLFTSLSFLDAYKSEDFYLVSSFYNRLITRCGLMLNI
jgi:hypothetical protein